MIVALCGAPPAPAQPTTPAPASAVDVLSRRAAERRRAGDTEGEFDLLARILEVDASHAAAHQRLAELTGPAPRDPLPTLEARVERALAHPYDPVALLAAGEGLADRGRVEQAQTFLEKVVWLADLHPQAALAALVKLRSLVPKWAATRIVPVQAYGDLILWSEPGWQFQQRTLWLSVSNTLDEVLHTRFVPIEIGEFKDSALPNDLDVIHRAFARKVPAAPEGILAGFTGREVPDDLGVYKTGVAELLGRTLIVRLRPGETQSRVLVHEVLHLYGAIHVLDDVESLMNPTSDSLVLDAPSIRIVRAMRTREFGAGGIEDNVVPLVDLPAAITAYRKALSVNLLFRNAGIVEAQESSSWLRDDARMAEAKSLDPHLADAARVVGALLLADGRRAEALRMLDLAIQLYGGEGPRAAETVKQADRLRAVLAGGADPAVSRAPSDPPPETR